MDVFEVTSLLSELFKMKVTEIFTKIPQNKRIAFEECTCQIDRKNVDFIKQTTLSVE